MSAVSLKFKAALAVIVVGCVAYTVYRAGKGIAAAPAEIAHALNPFNNDNVINQAATAAYQAATGSTGTIGTDIYDAVQAIDKRLDSTSDAMRKETEEYGYPWAL